MSCERWPQRSLGGEPADQRVKRPGLLRFIGSVNQRCGVADRVLTIASRRSDMTELLRRETGGNVRGHCLPHFSFARRMVGSPLDLGPSSNILYVVVHGASANRYRFAVLDASGKLDYRRLTMRGRFLSVRSPQTDCAHCAVLAVSSLRHIAPWRSWSPSLRSRYGER
jgi:hypothetical protein